MSRHVQLKQIKFGTSRQLRNNVDNNLTFIFDFLTFQNETKLIGFVVFFCVFVLRLCFKLCAFRL